MLIYTCSNFYIQQEVDEGIQIKQYLWKNDKSLKSTYGTKNIKNM